MMPNRPLFVVAALGVPAPCLAQVTPVRSSLETAAQIRLSVVDLTDLDEAFDEQLGTLDRLGPLSVPVSISNPSDGVFSGDASGDALFHNTESGSFIASAEYNGNGSDGSNAQSFMHTMSSEFQYDFRLAGEGSALFEGALSNSGPSPIGFTLNVSVYAANADGNFTGPFFSELVTDPVEPGSSLFSITVPLDNDSNLYRIEMRLGHSGNSILNTDPETGTLDATFTIDTQAACPADFAPPGNPDGVLNFFDISAFIGAFTAMDPAADFAPPGNPDGVFNFFDVSAYIAAFNAGCP